MAGQDIYRRSVLREIINSSRRTITEGEFCEYDTLKAQFCPATSDCSQLDATLRWLYSRNLIAGVGEGVVGGVYEIFRRFRITPLGKELLLTGANSGVLTHTGSETYSRGPSTKEKPSAIFKNGDISITLQKDVFEHVQKLLNSKHHHSAVEEAYKIVRKKLKEITGKEKATDAFNSSNYEKIFGHQPADEVEKDFFEGVKFLHMSIQFLRNEKAHTPAQVLDKNLAIHYISLASLAYDLITRKDYGGQ